MNVSLNKRGRIKRKNKKVIENRRESINRRKMKTRFFQLQVNVVMDCIYKCCRFDQWPYDHKVTAVVHFGFLGTKALASWFEFQISCHCILDISYLFIYSYWLIFYTLSAFNISPWLLVDLYFKFARILLYALYVLVYSSITY